MRYLALATLAAVLSFLCVMQVLDAALLLVDRVCFGLLFVGMSCLCGAGLAKWQEVG